MDLGPCRRIAEITSTDPEGHRRCRLRRSQVFSRDISCLSIDLISSICSLVCQGYELLCEHKQRALAVSFVMLETISLVLDVFGQSRRGILAAFLLSVFGFVMTILSCMLARTRVHAERQLGVVEFGFSVVQLIATFLAVLGIKINNYTTPVLLLVFSIIAAVFIFRKDENILGSLSPTNEYENELLSNENELQVNENELQVNENELLVDENELQLMETVSTENSSTPNEIEHMFQNTTNVHWHYSHLLKGLLNINVRIPSRFHRNPTYWKWYLVKLVQNIYYIEVEFRGSGGTLRLDYPEDADNKSLHGDDELDNKLNMGVKNINARRHRKAVDRKLKQETEMSVENLQEEKKSK